MCIGSLRVRLSGRALASSPCRGTTTTQTTTTYLEGPHYRRRFIIGNLSTVPQKHSWKGQGDDDRVWSARLRSGRSLWGVGLPRHGGRAAANRDGRTSGEPGRVSKVHRGTQEVPRRVSSIVWIGWKIGNILLM